MRRNLTAVVLAFLLAGCSGHDIIAPSTGAALSPGQTAFQRSSSTPIAGRYIVVLKAETNDVDAESQAVARRHAGRIRRTYKSALRGFTMELSDSAVGALRADPSVAYVEQDRVISISASMSTPLVNAASGQCLATVNGGTASMTPATIAPCSGAAAQVIELPSTGTPGQVLFFGTSTCLDDFWANGKAGDVVGLYPCVTGAPNERWTLTSAGALTGINGLCVAATATGASLTLQVCDGSAAQRWTTSAPAPAPAPAPPTTRFDASVVNAASGLCLATQNGSSASMTPAVVAPCSGSAAQVLNLPPVGTAGQVLFYGPSMCLDDFWANGKAGDVVGIYPCVTGAPNESWTLTTAGQLKGINGLCVGTSGSGVTLQVCNGGSTQQWSTGSSTPAPGATTQTGADWGLDRMDQRSRPLDGSFTYQANGSGVTAYIIDTGILLTHAEFGGRATTGFDAVTTGGSATDCNGHGTHVAGTVGGAAYGVAKNVRLVAVRVLDCNGSGTTSGVIAGIDWVTANRVLPAVANLSLGGDFSQALNDAVERSIAAGVVYAVAAGNNAVDACTASPASAPSALAVGATDAADAFAGFSNYGRCVKINAPGVSIVSAWIGSNTATSGASGTSMASPHVAGAAAAYLQKNPGATAAAVRAALTGNATSNVIQGIGNGTPNLLLYSR